MFFKKKAPWNKGMIKQNIAVCRYCGASFNQLYGKNQVFCSRECSHKDPIKNKKVSL